LPRRRRRRRRRRAADPLRDRAQDFANVPALFEVIDALVAKGTANDWGLSQISLEDVFVGLDVQRAPTAAASAVPADATPDASSTPREAFADVAFRPSTGKQVRAIIRTAVLFSFSLLLYLV
jgi:hypothetical protein